MAETRTLAVDLQPSEAAPQLLPTAPPAGPPEASQVTAGPSLSIPLATAAPLVASPAPAAARAVGPGLPSGLLRHLLEAIAALPLPSLQDALPALRILALAVAAGVALRLTGATLHAIDGVPVVGGLLELVGLVSLLRFLARNALRQQKRAELLGRIETLRKQLMG